MIYKIIRWLENIFKPKFITLKLCKKYNCQFNHGEVCFLRDDIKDKTNYCELLMSDHVAMENVE